MMISLLYQDSIKFLFLHVLINVFNVDYYYSDINNNLIFLCEHR